MRPVIGITSYAEDAAWGVWSTRAVLLPHAYAAKVAAAGALPVVLPAEAAGDPAVVARLDGLVLAGGADLDPVLYDQPPHPMTTGVSQERDHGEQVVLRAALERDLPVLGICRGMQMMTVCAGGSLHQHLPDLVGHDGHRPAPGEYGVHAVDLAEGSLAASVLGKRTEVLSYHHQGVESTGSLTATGWAEDGTVEVVEVPDRRFAVGVLWHPERGEDPALFDALVAAAR